MNSTPPVDQTASQLQSESLGNSLSDALFGLDKLLFARLSKDIHPGLVLNLFTTANQKANTCETPVDEMSILPFSHDYDPTVPNTSELKWIKKMSIRLNSWIYAISKVVESYYMTSYRH